MCSEGGKPSKQLLESFQSFELSRQIDVLDVDDLATCVELNVLLASNRQLVSFVR